MGVTKFVILMLVLLATLALANALDCEYDYMTKGQWCYKVMGPADSFDIAHQSCKEEDGELASIHDFYEDDFIATFGLDLLIGLHYSNGAPESYAWSDGTQLSYRNWEQNYPMDHRYFGDCVMFQKTGTWINVECFASAQFVCKKEPSLKPSSESCPVPPKNQFLDSGVVFSPGYPGNYYTGLSCEYLLLAMNGLSVTIEITEIKLGAEDIIEIFGGLAPNMADRLAVLQGDLTDVPMTYTTPAIQNKMLVRFSSKSQTGGHWKFHYYSKGLNYCPSKLNHEGEGTIYPVGYPYAYGRNLVCDYHLSVNKGEVMDIVFSKIDIEPDTAQIAIYDEPTASGLAAEILTRNLTAGHTFQSTSSDVVVRFVSGPSHNLSLTGWSATFKKTDCIKPWFRGGEAGLGYCYVVLKEAGNYKQCSDLCASKGAKLLTIQNAFQNKLIKNEMGSAFWLGLVNTYGMWEWADGSKSEYRNWFYGEPSASSHNQCARMAESGEWYSDKCDDRLTSTVCFKP